MRKTHALAVLLVAGCTSLTEGGDDGIAVRTSAETYQPGEPIEAHVLNLTHGTVYVSHCNHRMTVGIERRAGVTWEQYGQSNGPFCIAIYPMGELPIEEGRELSETLQIEHAGEFRLRVGARRAHEDFGSDVAFSPPFTVRSPPD